MQTNRRIWGTAGAVLAVAVLSILVISWMSAASSGGKSTPPPVLPAAEPSTGDTSASGPSDRRDRPAQAAEARALALDFRAFRDVRINENGGSDPVHLPAAVKNALGKHVQLEGIGFYYLAGMYDDRVCGFLLLPPFAVASGKTSAPDDQAQWSVLVECSRASWGQLPDYPRPVRARVEGTLVAGEPNLNGYLFTMHATRVDVQPLESEGLKSNEGGPPCPQCGLRHAPDPSSKPACCDGCRHP